MSEYADAEAYATTMEAFADDAALAVQAMENGNNRHPMATWLLGVQFAYRHAAYEARVINDE
jgi:hypothetical protein